MITTVTNIYDDIGMRIAEIRENQLLLHLQLIGDLDQLLATRGRVRQVDLHPHSEKEHQVKCVSEERNKKS